MSTPPGAVTCEAQVGGAVMRSAIGGVSVKERWMGLITTS
jgi:hypothetical protein